MKKLTFTQSILISWRIVHSHFQLWFPGAMGEEGGILILHLGFFNQVKTLHWKIQAEHVSNTWWDGLNTCVRLLSIYDKFITTTTRWDGLQNMTIETLNL